uniref:Uncharacterized protein n=1 Tax=Polysiphonia infestans TaxID=2006978 RepID=A0A1Z1ME64_9FLOR|nr:hypothetical protein [Polysiphonia infestans]ARW64310.1 hypothetical protein [Polysiphonia infestans]
MKFNFFSSILVIKTMRIILIHIFSLNLYKTVCI